MDNSCKLCKAGWINYLCGGDPGEWRLPLSVCKTDGRRRSMDWDNRLGGGRGWGWGRGRREGGLEKGLKGDGMAGQANEASSREGVFGIVGASGGG